MSIQVHRKLSAYGYKAAVTPEDAVRIRKTKGIRLTKSTFVSNADSTVFPGESAPWKNVKGMDALKAVNPDVAAALEEARTRTAKCMGLKGSRTIGDRDYSNQSVCMILTRKKDSERKPRKKQS